MAKFTTTDTDPGFKKLHARIADSKNSFALIGVQGAQASAAKQGGDDVTVVQVATVHEFGATIQIPEHSQDLHFKEKGGIVGNRFMKKGKSNFAQTVTIPAHTVTVPERSFIRSTMDARREEFVEFSRGLWSGVLVGKLTLHKALDTMGEKIKGAIQERFRDNDWEPLKYRDGTPLVDKGQLVNSIRSVTEMGGK